MTKSNSTGLEVAVIGYSGRFNNCNNVEEYWSRLTAGAETFRVFTEEELSGLGISEETYKQENYVNVKGNLVNRECFDSAFFGYTPGQAQVMDPQTRIFHEIVWDGLEMAGYSPGKTNKKIGLYATASDSTMWQMMMALGENAEYNPFETSYLSSKDYLCALIAYKLNLKGPAVFTQTACSSSLVAVHQAVRALLTGDCEIAVAGGVSASLLDVGGYTYQENLIYAPDGHCRAFDAEANGTLKGEGGGVVVLKKYQHAVRDNDTIHAIIKGTAINNDGNDKIGFSAPGITGQRKVIQQAIKVANVDPDSVSYVETHGTGTKLGDPVEFTALNAAYNQQDRGRTAIGSVKSNLGHLDAAAGIASLIKVILMMKHRQIPASLHFKTPNPNIDFANSSFYVNNTHQAWKSDGGVLRAGISSFGIGGTNCHLILQESAAADAPPEAGNAACTIQLSARTEEKVAELSADLARFLRENKTVRLADVAYTLNTGRADFNVRKTITAHSVEGLISTLTTNGGSAINRVNDKLPSGDALVFVFSGQGSQYVNMGRGLYEQYPFFKSRMDECFALIEKHHHLSLAPELYPAGGGEGSKINETLYAQLSLFATSYSLASFLIELGLEPAALIGHSIGEYAGAVLAGVLSLEDAIRIIGKRASLMQGAERGKMCAVFAGEQRVKELLPADLSIAAVNAPDLVVVSGNSTSVDEFAGTLASREIECRSLHTSHAFHSAMMDDVLAEYTAFLNGFTFGKPAIPLVSNVSGAFFADEIDAAYWSTHLRQPVRFGAGIDTLVAAGYDTFVEVGPGDQLVKLIKRIAGTQPSVHAVNALRQPVEPEQDPSYLMGKLSELWRLGKAVRVDKLYQNHSGKRIPLPAYPFEKTRFPFQSSFPEVIKRLSKRFAGPDNGPDFRNWLYKPVWKEKKLPFTAPRIPADGRVLVFCDDQGYADALLGQMGEQAAGLIRVTAGGQYEKVNAARYTIDPKAFESYRQLFNDLKTENVPVTVILHAFGLNAWPASAGGLDEALYQGYLSLSFLAKALAGQGFEHNLALRVLARETTRVLDTDAVNPLKATSLGALKVISVEHAQMHCKLIDIGGDDLDDKRFIPELENEIFAADKRIAVAYRGGTRYVQAVTKAPDGPGKSPLRSQGCYLITGGLGGIGLSIAQDLARQEKAKLALVSRRELPAVAQWDEWLASHDSADATSEIIGKVREMEAHGAEVVLVSADVADPVQMKDAIAQVERRFGKIDGLIWAAGVIDFDGVVQRRTTEQLLANLQCKVHGILTVSALLDFQSLDFVALFSSTGNVHYKEKFGQVAYNAANEFVDAYAQSLAGTAKVSAIQWCDWKDVGMSVTAVSKKYQHLNKTEISKAEANQVIAGGVFPAEGVALFRRCLENAGTAFIISGPDQAEGLDLEKYENGADDEVAAVLTPPAAGAFERPEVSTAYQEPTDPMQGTLAAMCTRLFGITKVGVHDDFFELGGDSLTAIQFINQINKELRVKISLEDFFNRPTVAALAQFVREKQAGPAAAPSREPVVASDQYYPLLPAQKRIFILQKLYPEQTSYNQIFPFKTESLRMEPLRSALHALTRRHPVLRATFAIRDNEPRQWIHADVPVQIGQYAIGSDEEIHRVLAELEKPFDLAQAPLFRVSVVHSDSGQNYLIIDIHHIVSDGISNRVFLDDLVRLYNGEVLSPLPATYLDYVAYFHSPEVQQELREEEQYWLNRFRNYVQPKGLVPDFPRSPSDTRPGAVHQFAVPDPLTGRIKELVKKEGVTLFTFHLAVLYVLLNKLTGESDLVVGTTHMGRDAAGFERVMGMFIETVALRNSVEKQLSFADFLGIVRDNVYKDFDNRKYPFEELVDKLNRPKNGNRNPLFDVVFSSDDLGGRPAAGRAGSGGPFEGVEKEKGSVSFDLLVTFKQEKDRLVFSLEYNANLFRPETIAAYGKFYQSLLEQIAGNREISLDRLLLLDAAEQQSFFNQLAGPQGSGADHAFARIGRTADACREDVALAYGNKEVTYGQLMAQVDQLAHHLQTQCGVGPGDPVAVYMSRSDYLITAILAVVKARAVFVPIDVAFPEQRVQYILDTSAVRTLLTDTDNMFNVPFFTGTSFAMDVQMEALEPVDPVPFAGTPDDLAYILYTSGSTGTPKGVKVSHRSFSNYLDWLNTYYFGDRNGYDMPLFTSISFDFTLTSIFSPLMRGDRVRIYGDGITPSQSLKDIFSSGIRAAKLTPAHVDMLAALNLPSSGLAVAILGGEALLQRHVSVLKGLNAHMQVFNEYGPTEATVACTAVRVTGEESVITIGKAIDNAQVFVLDENLNLLPPNVPGEIYISGVCLSDGYMDEKNTAEKFIGVPGHENKKMYRSGDKGMRSAGGELIYLGRMVENDQVKIRGNRIELKEIENVLAGMDKIDRAVAAVKKLNGEDTIVGYYLSREEVPERSIRSYLLKYLPPPMMPGVFMRLKQLPVNVNGKLDYAALPDPEIPKSDSYVPPVNEIELRMVGIWAEVLKLDKDKIGLNDDFFSLGGNSLRVVQLSQQIEAAFNRSVPVAELFDVDTISAFIKHFFNDAEEEVAEEDDSTDMILDRLSIINNIKLNRV